MKIEFSSPWAMSAALLGGSIILYMAYIAIAEVNEKTRLYKASLVQANKQP